MGGGIRAETKEQRISEFNKYEELERLLLIKMKNANIPRSDGSFTSMRLKGEVHIASNEVKEGLWSRSRMQKVGIYPTWFIFY